MPHDDIGTCLMWSLLLWWTNDNSTISAMVSLALTWCFNTSLHWISMHSHWTCGLNVDWLEAELEISWWVWLLHSDMKHSKDWMVYLQPSLHRSALSQRLCAWSGCRDPPDSWSVNECSLGVDTVFLKFWIYLAFSVFINSLHGFIYCLYVYLRLFCKHKLNSWSPTSSYQRLRRAYLYYTHLFPLPISYLVICSAAPYNNTQQHACCKQCFIWPTWKLLVCRHLFLWCYHAVSVFYTWLVQEWTHWTLHSWQLLYIVSTQLFLPALETFELACSNHVVDIPIYSPFFSII